MSYQDEARTRVLHFTGAGFVSLVIATVVAGVVTRLFWDSADSLARRRIFAYSFVTVFAVVCGFLVYRIDKKLARRFNANP